MDRSRGIVECAMFLRNRYCGRTAARSWLENGTERDRALVTRCKLCRETLVAEESEEIGTMRARMSESDGEALERLSNLKSVHICGQWRSRFIMMTMTLAGLGSAVPAGVHPRPRLMTRASLLH